MLMPLTRKCRGLITMYLAVNEMLSDSFDLNIIYMHENYLSARDQLLYPRERNSPVSSMVLKISWFATVNVLIHSCID
jgi:hypothetical protein